MGIDNDRIERKRGSFDRIIAQVKERTGIDPMADDFTPPPCGLCGARLTLTVGGRIAEHYCPPAMPKPVVEDAPPELAPPRRSWTEDYD